MDWDSREEYVPRSGGLSSSKPRSASTGRIRALSATYGPSSQRPVSAYAGPGDNGAGDWRTATSPAAPGRRVMSAVPGRNQPSPQAWAARPEAGGGLLDFGGGGRQRVHVQSLAANKGREALAEDVVALREQVTRLREEVKLHAVEKRRLEAELTRTRQGLLKSEELLNNKERLMSPTMGISQLYRSPDTTHLVGNLKDQLREMKATRDQLTSELTSLQKSTRATKVSELQSELLVCHQELDRMQRMNEVMARRLQQAEAAAQQAMEQAQQARRAMDEYVNLGAPLEGPVKLSPSSSIAGGSVRKTLQVMHQAHKVLHRQAELLRAVFPPGMTLAELTEKARQRANTAGAPDVLNFLRNHVAKLNNELSGQPGAPASYTGSPANRPTSASRGLPSPAGSPGPMERAAERAAANAGPTGPPSHDAVLKAVADGVRKLRTLDEERFHANPDLEINSEQLADVMQLYVDEVRRLQGRPLASSPAPPAPAPPAAAPVVIPAVDNSADLNQLRSALQAAKDALVAAQAQADDARKAEQDVRTQNASLLERLRQAQADAKAAAAASSGGAPPPSASPAAPAPEAPTSAPAPEPEGVPYTVVVHTSDVSGGAFDGKVWVTLYGQGYNSSGEILLPSTRYSFDTGQADDFTIKVPAGCLPEGEKISHVGLRMGESEIGDVTWHVNKVDVSGPGGVSGTYYFEDWLKAGPVNLLFPKAPASGDKVDYEVTVSTWDTRGAGTDGEVYITVIGDLGAGQEVQLTPAMRKGGSGEPFQRGNSDVFTFKSLDVGDVSHVTVRLAAPKGASLHSGWALGTVQVVHGGTGMLSYCYLYDWLTQDTPRMTLYEGCTWQARSLYTVNVKTSDYKAADFEGAVYLTVNGWYNTTREVLLVSKPSSTSHTFDRNKTDTFTFRLEDVGPMTSLALRTEVASPDNVTWHLDSITVTNDSTGETAEFPASQWITAPNTDPLTLYKTTPEVQHKVQVFTAASSPALTAGLFITPSGMYGSATEEQLVNDSADGTNLNLITFEPGSVQEFNLKMSDVGSMASLLLRIVPAPGATSTKWQLDKILVTTGEGTTARTFTFKRADIIDASADEGKVTLARDVATCEYMLTAVTTASPEDSGFDGDVYVKLLGLDGNTEEIKLVNSAVTSPFKLDAATTFTFTAADVGKFNNIEVRIDGGSTNWWHPLRFDLMRTATGESATYKYNSWMATWSGAYTLYQQTYTAYKVNVYASPPFVTGPKPAFDGKVYIKLNGWNGGSEEYEATTESGGPLMPGGTASISLKCTESWVSYITIRVAGGRQPLHVRCVEVINEASGGSSTWYPYNAALGGPDNEAKADLWSGTLVEYDVTVHTAKGSTGLPQGAQALLMLTSDDSSSSGQEVELVAPEGGFNPGSPATVRVKMFQVNKPSAGKLRVLGGSGKWGLSRLELTDVSGSTGRLILHNAVGSVACPGSVNLQKLATIDYTVTVRTADVRGADSDGRLVLRLIGDKGETEDKQLTQAQYDNDWSAWNSALQTGVADVHVFSSPDVGDLKAVAVMLAPPAWGGQHSGWNLQQVEVLNTVTGMVTSFPYNRWIDVGAEEVLLNADTSTQTYVDYVVTVVTSWSGEYTDEMYLTLDDGSGTKTHRILLPGRSGKVSTLPNGDTVMTFTARAASLGTVSTAKLELDPNGYYYMRLKRLQVVNKGNNAAALFKYDNSIYVGSEPTLTKAPLDVYYSVTSYTNNFPDAGFDGEIWVKLHGEEGDSGEVQMYSYWSGSPSPGDTNYYYFYEANVGRIQAVSVRLNATGSSKKWGLGYIDLYNYSASQSSTFEHQAYIKAGDDGTRIARRQNTVTYEVTTYTSDVQGAGTDGAVYLTLSGDSGSTEEILLPSDTQEDFARGVTRTFTISGTDVGENKSLVVRLASKDSNDWSGLHSAWHLSKIEVLDKSSGYQSTFNHNNWVSRDDWSVTIKQSSTVLVLKSYRVQVTTTSLKGADFDGDVYIMLSDWWGQTSEEVQLAPPGKSHASFRAGQTAEFSIKTLDVYPCNLSVRMVPTESDPSWHLDNIKVIDPSGGEYQFFHNNWLNSATPSASLYRNNPKIEYKVVVITGAKEDASFDGEAHISFTGSWGQTSETQLVNDSSCFEPGSQQEFSIKADNVDILSHVNLRIVASGKSSKWYVERLDVTNLSTSTTQTFKVEDYLTPDSTRQVGVFLPEAEYQVNLVTGSPCDFDGQAALTLFGMSGQSDEITLTLEDGSKPSFTENSTVTCKFKAPDVGALRYVRLKMIEGNTYNANWNVSRIELANTTSGATALLQFGSTLNTCWWSETSLYPPSATTYKVTVHTSSLANAAWDGDVYLTLKNYWSPSVEIKLASEKGTDAFKPGASETYTITTSDCSYVSEVVVRVVATGKERQWHLGHIEVQDTGCSWADPRGFVHNNWVGGNAGDRVTLSSSSSFTYQSVVLALDQSSEPFDGAVYMALTMAGTDQVSNEVKMWGGGTVLDPGSDTDMGKAVFYASSGTISGVRLRGERAGTAEKWCPARVLLNNGWGTGTVCKAAPGGKNVVLGNPVTLDLVPSVDLVITVQSADVPGNGTDGAVYLSLTGDCGQSLEQRLWGTFERGSKDTATLSFPDPGTITKVTLSHRDNGSGLHSQWNVAYVSILHSATGMSTTFNYNGWVDRGQTVELTEASRENAYTAYEITVVTDSGESCGFDGKVRLRMHCGDSEADISPAILLGDAQATPGLFGPGKKDVVTVQGKKSGDAPQRISISVDSGNSTYSWKPVQFIIKNIEAGWTGRYSYDSWVYSWWGYQTVEPTPTVEYRLNSYTNNYPDSAYEGLKFVTLHGERGDSEEKRVYLSSYPGADDFSFVDTYDIGRITGITVNLPGSGKWGLGWMQAINQSTQAEVFFDVQKYLLGGTSTRLAPTITTVEYEVTVYTQDVRGAGTDGAVYCRLRGANGATDEMQLLNGDDNTFKRGGCDKFTITGIEVGESRVVELRLAAPGDGDSSVLHSSWALDKVEVLNKSTGIKGTYNYGSWLARPSASASLEEATSVQALNTYKVYVTTGSLPGADFDGDVFITLGSWSETSGELPLAAAGQKHASLKNSETQEFTVRAVDLYVTNITVRVVPTEDDPAWLLDNIKIVNESNGNEAVFYHSNWLDHDTPSVNIWRNNPMVDYTVKLYTTDQVDAGFDGEVHLTLRGNNGNAEEVQLVNYSERLAPGSTEEFTIKAADVGLVRTAVLRIVANKKRQWHCDKVEVVDASGTVSTFSCRAWVDADGEAQVTLEKDLPETEYKLVLVTSDVADGAFEGDVYITLGGAEGTTGEVKLVLPDTAAGSTGAAPAPAAGSAATSAATKLKFDVSSTVTLPVKAKSVGQLNSITVRTDASALPEGAAKTWHLARVEVTNESSGTAAIFPYKSYVSDGGCTIYPQTSYTYAVRVSLMPDQGETFDGDLLLGVESWWSSAPETKLVNGKGPDTFKAGAVEDFSIKVTDVSYINNIKLRAAATGKSKRIYIDKVEISYADQPDPSGYCFLVKSWVNCGEEPVSFSCTSLYSYDLTVYTAEGSGEAFNGDVYACISESPDTFNDAEEVKLELRPKDAPAVAADSSSGVTDGSPAPAPSPALVPGSAAVASFKARGMWNVQGLRLRTTKGSSGSSKWSISRAELWSNDSYSRHHFYFGTTLTTPAKAQVAKLAYAEYDITFVTSDIKGNGHDGFVTFTLEGDQCTTDDRYVYEHQSSDPAQAFERGHKDTFSQSMPDLGKLKKMSIKLWETDCHGQWHLDRVEVLHKESGMMTTFTCGAWVDPQPWVDDSPTSGPATILMADGPARQVYLDYQVTIRTSDAADAAYDGEVRMVLEAEDGRKSYEQKLGVGGSGTGLFMVGGTDTLKLLASDLGKISKVHLNMASTPDSSATSWRPRKVEVENPATGDYALFLSDKQLYQYEAPHVLERAPQDTTYETTVYMGKGETFHGDVFVTLYGTEGRTDEMPLLRWGSSPTWYTDDWWSFSNQGYAVGALKYITIRCEKTFGDTSALSLDRVEVTNASTGATSTFQWGKPLPAGKSRQRIDKLMTMTDLELKITTTDTRGAGTDAEVYVTIEGDGGVMDEIKLSNAADNFTRGKTDKFTFRGPDVGANKRFTFRLAAPAGSSSAHSSWNLGEVALLDKQSGLKTAASYYNWVTPGVPAVVYESSSYQALYPYTVTVNTTQLKGADFSGEVYLALDGWNGTTDEVLLARPGAKTHTFSKGAQDTFSFKAEDLGSIWGVKLRIVQPDANATGFDRQWHLGSIDVVAEKDGFNITAAHDNWLYAGADPVLIYRSTDNIDYLVTLHVTPSSAAAFDGDVFYTMSGMWGSTDENQLVSDSPSALAPGTATEYSIRDSDLRKLYTMNIRLKQTGSQPPTVIQLDRVEVKNVGTGEVSVFPVVKPDGTLLATATADNNWTLSLKKNIGEAEYKVSVVTSDVPDGAFDGSVYITLNGTEGSSEEIRLPANPSQAFNVKQTDTFNIKASDVGAFNYVIMRIEATGASTQWHLNHVELSKVADSGAPPLVFSYKSYLNQYNSTAYLWMQSASTYSVTLITSPDVADGGFDGDVYVSLQSQWGDVEEVKLEPATVASPDAAPAVEAAAKAEAALEPGNAAKYVMKIPYTYDITAAKVRLEARPGGKSRWHLSSFRLHPEWDTSSPYEFTHNNWIQAGQSNVATISARRLYSYSVTLVVGPQQAQAYTGGLAMVVVGEEEDGEELTVIKPGQTDFTLEAGASVSATVLGPRYVTPVGVRLRALPDPSSPSASLALERVEVFDPDSWNTYAFWRGASAKPLVAGSQYENVPRSTDVNYNVTVVTADIKGAGTDGSVTITIEGEKGSAKDLTLSNDYSANFERGHTDVFDVTAPDVGVIKSVTVKLSSDAHSGWLLDSVSIISDGTGLQHDFKHGGWVPNTSTGDGSSSASVTLTDTRGGVRIKEGVSPASMTRAPKAPPPPADPVPVKAPPPPAPVTPSPAPAAAPEPAAAPTPAPAAAARELIPDTVESAAPPPAAAPAPVPAASRPERPQSAAPSSASRSALPTMTSDQVAAAVASKPTRVVDPLAEDDDDGVTEPFDDATLDDGLSSEF